MSDPTVTLTHGFAGSKELLGSRQALEAHPLCPPGLFEGYGTRWKASRTLQHAGRKYQIFALGRRFRLEIHCTDAERRAARDRQDAALALEYKAKAVQSKLASMPTSSAQWRSTLLQKLETFLGFLDATARGEGLSRSGYALDADGQALVGIHLQAIRRAFETSAVVFDADARQTELDAIMAPLRQAVPQVQTFVQQLQGGAQ